MDNKEELRNDPKTLVAPYIANYLANGDTFKKLTEV